MQISSARFQMMALKWLPVDFLSFRDGFLSRREGTHGASGKRMPKVEGHQGEIPNDSMRSSELCHLRAQKLTLLVFVFLSADRHRRRQRSAGGWPYRPPTMSK